MCSRDPTLSLSLKGHTKDITAIKFRTSNELVTSSKDSNLLFWNLNTKDIQTYQYSGHSAAINDIDCSQNGKLVVSGSNDKTFTIWVPSLNNGSDRIQAHFMPITSVHFSHNARKLLTGSEDKCMKLWDTSRRSFLHSFVGHNHHINCARFSNDGKTVVSCAEDKTVKVWDAETQKCLHTFANHRASANKVAIFQKYIACVYQSGSVRIYDFAQRKLAQHYVLHDNLTSLDWHPTGKFLVVGKSNGSTTILDILEGRPIFNMQGLGGSITSVAFSPSGKQFVCGSTLKNLLVWDWDVETKSSESSSIESSSASSLEFSHEV